MAAPLTAPAVVAEPWPLQLGPDDQISIWFPVTFVRETPGLTGVYRTVPFTSHGEKRHQGRLQRLVIQEPLTLPLRCSTCGRPITVVYRQEESSERVAWTCPYDNCLTGHAIYIGGTVIAVAMG